MTDPLLHRGRWDQTALHRRLLDEKARRLTPDSGPPVELTYEEFEAFTETIRALYRLRANIIAVVTESKDRQP